MSSSNSGMSWNSSVQSSEQDSDVVVDDDDDVDVDDSTDGREEGPDTDDGTGPISVTSFFRSRHHFGRSERDILNSFPHSF